MDRTGKGLGHHRLCQWNMRWDLMDDGIGWKSHVLGHTPMIVDAEVGGIDAMMVHTILAVIAISAGNDQFCRGLIPHGEAELLGSSFP